MLAILCMSKEVWAYLLEFFIFFLIKNPPEEVRSVAGVKLA